tara:strand:- start:1159 stop:1344 length:186 start_codon:yes stop_codon:yes gene_type:complete
MKPIAKSLHTITVIVQVATMLRKNNLADSIDGAVALALEALELSGKPDVYGLTARATKSVR